VQSTAGCAAAKRPHDRGGGRGWPPEVGPVQWNAYTPARPV